MHLPSRLHELCLLISANATPLTPSATGMLGAPSAGTGSRYVLGYFPLVTVSGSAAPAVFTLNFTIEKARTLASYLRIFLLDTRPNGIGTSDGSATKNAYNGDQGYGFFSSASTVGSLSATNLSLRTYQRTSRST